MDMKMYDTIKIMKKHMSKYTMLLENGLEQMSLQSNFKGVNIRNV